MILNALVAATLTLTSLISSAGPVSAQGPVQGPVQSPVQGPLERPSTSPAVEDLLAELARPGQEGWARIERQILRLWGRSGSDTIDYLFGRGQAALQAGQADDAIEIFSAVIDHDPDFAEAWNGRATAYYMANRLGQSLADIEQVLIRNPSHFGALAGMGMILEQLNRPEDALRAYRASLAVHPYQPGVLESVARLELASTGSSL